MKCIQCYQTNADSAPPKSGSQVANVQRERVGCWREDCSQSNKKHANLKKKWGVGPHPALDRRHLRGAVAAAAPLLRLPLVVRSQRRRPHPMRGEPCKCRASCTARDSKLSPLKWHNNIRFLCLLRFVGSAPRNIHLRFFTPTENVSQFPLRYQFTFLIVCVFQLILNVGLKKWLTGNARSCNW